MIKVFRYVQTSNQFYPEDADFIYNWEFNKAMHIYHSEILEGV